MHDYADHPGDSAIGLNETVGMLLCARLSQRSIRGAHRTGAASYLGPSNSA